GRGRTARVVRGQGNVCGIAAALTLPFTGVDQFGGVRCSTHVGVGVLTDLLRQRSLAPWRRAAGASTSYPVVAPAERSRALPSAGWQRWVSQQRARLACLSTRAVAGALV